MSEKLVKELRVQADSAYLSSMLDEAADRIEELEKALIHIWSWYPTNVSNPHQQINEMKDFAFKVIKEGNENAKPD